MSEPAQGRARHLEVVNGDDDHDRDEARQLDLQRLEILTRHERAQAHTIRSLRAELHAAHARSHAHDEQIRQALGQLIRQRDELAAQLHAAEARLERIRRSLPGRAWRWAKRCKARIARRSA